MTSDLFAQHLDLAPLRGRRRGSVTCIFHDDRSPSLSVDLDRGLFNCFGCGARGGLRAFARLVGLPTSGPDPRAVEDPRRLASQMWQRQLAHHARWGPLMRGADAIRIAHQRADELRRQVTPLGPESEAAWELAAEAASLDTLAETLAHDIDSVIRLEAAWSR